jgi:tRNA(Ile)-lysidine synthase
MSIQNPKSQIKNSWTPLHGRLQRTLRQRKLLQRNQRLLVAVSGGQDSLCLLKLLLDLQPKWDWHLGIAHCDHQWQKDVGTAKHVEGIAQSWQVPFYLETAVEITQSEGKARQWRYQALTHMAKEHGYECILTGHTQSDRAETILYNLIRGSGADGLQALTWRRQLALGIQLLRPLLEVTRAETFQFCQDLHLPIWEDAYNQDLKYARNRIRQELIPYLRTQFNPQVEQSLAQTAELLRAEVEYMEKEAQALLQKAMGNEEGQGTQNVAQNSPLSSQYPISNSLNRCILRDSPLALQRRAIRQFLSTVLPSAPSFEQIEKLTALITAPNRSQTDPFPGGAIALVQGDWIILTRIAGSGIC